MTHPEHAQLYAADAFASGFGRRHLARLIDIACENQPQAGYSVAEVGAGTGGLTKQARFRCKGKGCQSMHAQATDTAGVPAAPLAMRKSAHMSLIGRLRRACRAALP